MSKLRLPVAFSSLGLHLLICVARRWARRCSSIVWPLLFILPPGVPVFGIPESWSLARWTLSGLPEPPRRDVLLPAAEDPWSAPVPPPPPFICQSERASAGPSLGLLHRKWAQLYPGARQRPRLTPLRSQR